MTGFENMNRIHHNEANILMNECNNLDFDFRELDEFVVDWFVISLRADRVFVDLVGFFVSVRR